MADPTSARSPFTVMEAGFRIIPGKEGAFFERQGATVPVAMQQPGFVAVYGGPIHASSWLYFGVRFASAADMEAWQHHDYHREVQRMAYENWWTAVYIRKWQRIDDTTPACDRYMCETRVQRSAPLDAMQLDALQAGLGAVQEFGVRRFETLTGDHEPQPWQLVGPLEIAPSDGTVLYSLITHWPSVAHARRWRDSAAYAGLADYGRVESEVFAAMPEPGKRHGLREDRLQRQWTLDSDTAPTP